MVIFTLSSFSVVAWVIGNARDGLRIQDSGSIGRYALGNGGVQEMID